MMTGLGATPIRTVSLPARRSTAVSNEAYVKLSSTGTSSDRLGGIAATTWYRPPVSWSVPLRTNRPSSSVIPRMLDPAGSVTTISMPGCGGSAPSS